MRVPLSWLREMVHFELEPETLAERLTLLGMEVKGIQRIGADWQNVVVGELLEVGPHPGSGKLSLTRVRVGSTHPVLSIVCGATNIAVGQRVPVALPGSVLPGGRHIEVSRIAGEESQGMLCSGDELHLTSDADGILILPADTPIGMPVSEVLGDVVLDVDVKPNRGDALSIVGLAREVAAAVNGTVRWPKIEVPESGDATSDHVSIEVQDAVRCPRIVLRYVDGVTVGPSPIKVQRRLMAAGVRPISNVVDASNYVMLELGKPIHTFDASAVVGGKVIVRTAVPGEQLETLDHVTRELDAETLIIADANGPIGIAGVMGGAASEVHAATTAVIVESAIFDPVSVRRTAFKYALRSEASLRFEKGQEHRLARIGADRAAQLIAEWAGGRVAMGAVDTDPMEPQAGRLAFRPSRVSRLLGVDVSPDEQRLLLARVEIQVQAATADDPIPVMPGEAPLRLSDEAAGAVLVAIVPTHRRDLQIEADIAEEVARVRGYETLPSTRPTSENPPYRVDPWRNSDTLRNLFSGRGLSEVVTFALVSPQDHQRLGFAADDARTVRAANPVSADHSELRRSLLSGLLRVLADNERQRRDDVQVFELGHIHEYGTDGPGQQGRLGVLMAGAAQPPTWHGPRREVDLGDAKGLLEAVVERFAPDARVRFATGSPRPGVDHPGRTASVLVEIGGDTPTDAPIELGHVSELHPRLLDAAEIRAAHVVAAEIDLDALLALASVRRRADASERLPASERDVSIVVDERQPAGDIAAAIRVEAGPQLSHLWLFDRYQGPPLKPTEVNLGFRLRFQSTEEASSDDQADRTIDRVVRVLADRFGARLRD